MLIRTPPTTLLQICCEIINNSRVIIKNIIDPDDNFSSQLLGMHGKFGMDWDRYEGVYQMNHATCKEISLRVYFGPIARDSSACLC